MSGAEAELEARSPRTHAAETALALPRHDWAVRVLG